VIDDRPFWTGREDAASFRRAIDERIAEAEAWVARVLAVTGPRGVENTLRPFDGALFALDAAESQSSLIQNVHPDPTLREAAEQANQRASAARTALMLNRGLYDALAGLEAADAVTAHYLERLRRDFRLAGVDRDEATRGRVAALRDELVRIGQEFLRNIRDDRRQVVVRDPGELAGLPADFIDRHRPDDDGVIHLTTEYPDVFPVLAYARSDSLRRALHLEYNRRGWPKNVDVLARMVARRHELAGLLGHASWADYVTADKMARDAATASGFIDRVLQAAEARAAREYDELLAGKREEQAAAAHVEAWEAAYWTERLRRSKHGFDSQELRPYFPAAAVKTGVMDATGRLFGLTFRRIARAPVWHESVECWEALEGGALVGRFYLDLYPRPGKYTHAAQFGIRVGVTASSRPEAALVCNFPGGTAGDPGLMEHREVVTFFHEFGHLLHTLLARQGWAGMAGIATEFDFVEAPSQMLEEWAWDPAVLAAFARHHQTGAPIPAELVMKMKAANEVGKALAVRRQMALARLSLACHDRPPEQVDPDALYQTISEAALPYPFVEGTHFPCSFGHLDGYSAIYYTYMWSLVIAKDLFACFTPGDLAGGETARRYRACVLEAGGSAPAGALIERFLGRPFDTRAWETWLNG
jgi:thimet oligopeptidase